MSSTHRILILYSALVVIAVIATLIFYKPGISKERKLAKEEFESIPKTKKIKPELLELPEDYNWQLAASSCMGWLKKNGPINFINDGDINCQDWSTTFLWLWYMAYKQPPATCLIMRNVNPNIKTDYGAFLHAFIAIRTQNDWICVEPQAYYCDDWSLESFWKKQYDSNFNIWGHTKYYIKKMDIDVKLQRELIEKTKTEYFYGYDY
ncbi:MAG: hypothetical protein II610_07040 [Treponema sp.]|nr:hypothetical protein [Treponema sp.]